MSTETESASRSLCPKPINLLYMLMMLSRNAWGNNNLMSRIFLLPFTKNVGIDNSGSFDFELDSTS